MHTVVLGWFGGSTLWFLPLFWRVAKSALPGGSGLRGPGTIRLWLGFVCVLVASCTFEASLVGIDGVDRFGHALSGGFGHLLGRVGTPLVMLALFAASLPWLIGFRWARAVAWADAAFGLGLSGKRRARDADRRSRRASDDTSAVNAALPAATLAPRSLGRYARPTVWRPPASTRDAAASGAVRGNGAAAARQSVKQPAAFTPTEPTAAAGWLRGESDAAPRERVLSRDRAAGHAGHPADGSRAAAAGVSGAAATDASKAFAAARAAGGAAGSPATQTRAAPPQVKQANAAAPTRVTGTAAGGSSTRSTTRPRPATPSASSAQSPRASVTGTARQQPIASGGAPAPSRVPGYSRPASETPRVEPTSSVQETLRNIEENTARWTTLAGASLARRSHTETARPTSEAIADSVRTDPATVPDPTLDVTPVGPVEPIAGPLTGTSNTVTAAESLHHVADTNVPANPVPLADDDSVIMPAASAAATRKAEPAGPASNTESREPHATAMTHTMASESLPPLIQPAIDRPAATEATKAPPPELRSPVLPLFDEAPTLAEPESEARPQQRAAQSNTASDAASTLALQPPARADTDTDATLASWEVVGEAVTALRSGSSMLPRHVSSAAVPLDGYGTRHAPLLHIVSPIEATAAIPAPDSPAAGTSLPHAPTLSNVVRFPGTSAGQMAPHRVSPDDAPAHMAHIDPSSDDADNESSGAHLTPEPATAASAPAEATLAEATPAEATPAEATPAEPAAASAASAAPGPPRGFAANSFEFHAPAASHIELPSLDLLARASTDVEPVSDETLAETGQLIEQRLQEFKVPVTVVGASAGPVITRFEVEPALGVRGSQIVGLMKDLSRGLGLTSIRVVETIPGKTCMGLELPNARRQTIRLSEILEAGVYQNSPSRLTLAMGKDITGQPIVTDLAKAPHMLVAGTTGSGKSVAINAMIVSLLYKATPDDVRLIMIDPKMLELSVYEGIPHLLAPVVTDMKLAANALNWCVGEMEKRYRLMSAVGVRNLAGFNQKIRDAQAHEKKIGNPFSLTPDDPEPLSPLPLIVVVIDELADLMMVAGKKIEELIARLAQKARAAGIHLILATQRPSVDVITGLIKANIPTRVAFQVSSKIDSRTILDQMGAESLLGQGDMLFLPPGTGYPQRVHGAFVADEEVHRIVEHLKQFGEPQYEEGILDGPATEGAAQDLFGDAPDVEADPLYDEAVAFVVRTRRASISAVQRQLRIGYNRAARLVEQMEAAGLVSAMGINGSREVLAPGPSE